MQHFYRLTITVYATSSYSHINNEIQIKNDPLNAGEGNTVVGGIITWT